MSKQLLNGKETRRKLVSGVNQLADTVKVTLGAAGRNVAIGNSLFGGTRVTKDGVSVAKEVTLVDPVENLGAEMIKEASSKTGDLAGDGTTTATVLTQAMLNTALTFDGTVNMVEVKRGMDLATKLVIENLKTQAVDITNNIEAIKSVATVSANNDSEIGNLIGDAFQKIGVKGIITVEESSSSETFIDIVEGMHIDKGYVSPYFITDREKREVVFTNPYILLYDGKIEYIAQLIPTMELVAKENRPVVIIADEITDEALTVLVKNHVQGNLRNVFIKAPDFGDSKKGILEDIAIATGGTAIVPEKGMLLQDTSIYQLGTSPRVVVTADKTVIRTIKDDDVTVLVNDRVKELEADLANSTDEMEKSKLKNRISKLSSGIAVIKVGAATEVEMGEKKDRVDDALHATRAALEEGIICGGGIPLLRASYDLKCTEGDNKFQNMGIAIVKQSLGAPFVTLVQNAGVVGDNLLKPLKLGDKIEKFLRLDDNYYTSLLFREEIQAMISKGGNFGYNVKTQKFEDLVESGVIDPFKITRIALENATSVAGMVLTTESSIVEI